MLGVGKNLDMNFSKEGSVPLRKDVTDRGTKTNFLQDIPQIHPCGSY